MTLLLLSNWPRSFRLFLAENEKNEKMAENILINAEISFASRKLGLKTQRKIRLLVS